MLGLKWLVYMIMIERKDTQSNRIYHSNQTPLEVSDNKSVQVSSVLKN